MKYKIIGDSCLDLTKEMRKDPVYTLIPFTLMVGDRQFVDDESFDQKEFLRIVRESPECAKSACPSPEMFKEAYCCEEPNVFVITISGPLSGSYNSAVLAKSLYEEEYGKKNIAVIDSQSASCGQVNIALKIRELCEQGLSFDEVVAETLKYRDEMKTYFVLETLDTLRKNGRLTGLQAFFATKLNIKPVMSAEKGVIIKLDQARGIQKALQRMTETARKTAERLHQGDLHADGADRKEAPEALVYAVMPGLSYYVEWVLKQAQADGVRRLYFLARDGYLMYRMASELCMSRNIPVECRYLYGSRYAWRIPWYHLDWDGCLEKLCLDGLDVSFLSITERAGMDRKEARRRAKQLIERLEISTPSSETPVRQLSGGNVQKVLVGREIESSPNVIVTAYPVRGLDINSSYVIYDILNEQKKRGTGILFVGEDLDVMMALCDKIMVLCHGKVMGVVHADKTTKEDLGLMMTGSKDLVSEKKDKKLGKAKDSNLSEEQWQAAENAEEKTEDEH